MSWTNAVVTEAGLALQAKLVDGQTLGFLRVAAGTGTVDPASLANQTALVNEKQTLTFQPPNVLDGAKIKVPVMLNNIGLETGYTMQQLGFFADDPDDGEILYAIVQDEVGDTVPSQTESPGFVIEWAFVFQYGNAGSVTVTLDPVGLVSIGMVGQPGGVAGLGENGAVPIEQGGTGATTSQDAVDALGALFAIAAAAAYDPEGSYAVGDYCTNGGKLHKCYTAIPDGEPWTAEHWTETTVAAELAEVRASLSNKQDLIWLGIAEMDADLNDLKQIGTTAIHGTSKNVPPDVIPGNWGLLTVSANSKNGQVGCTQHLSIMVTEGYFPQIYERNWNGLNWSKWARIATATPPQEHAIVPKNGATLIDGMKNVFSKDQFGKLELHVGMNFSSVPAKGTEIFSLPQSFAPVGGIVAGSMVLSMGTACYPAFLTVNTDGAVVLQHNVTDYSGQIDLFGFMCFGTGGTK